MKLVRVLTVLAPLLLAGCRGGGGAGTGGGGQPPPVTEPYAGITTTVGPAGGTAAGYYGAQVVIPGGALTASVDIVVARDSTDAPALPPSGLDTAGAVYALTPHGTTLAHPATVRIPFEADSIPTDATPKLYKAEPGGAFAEVATHLDGDALVADITGFSWVLPAYASARPRMVYALTGVNGEIEISSFRIERSTGALSPATSSKQTGGAPLAVAVHPSRRFLYLTNAGLAPGLSSHNGIGPNSISVYALDPVSGAIRDARRGIFTWAGPTSTGPASVAAQSGAGIVPPPAAVVVHPTGKFVYVVNTAKAGQLVNYSTTPVNTDISVFAVDGIDGSLSGPVSTADSGGAPPRAIAFHPSGAFAYVTYTFAVGTPVGNGYVEQVKVFSVDSASGALTLVGGAAAGSGPRAVVVDPSGRYLYLSTSGSSTHEDEVRFYSINATSGLLTYWGGPTISANPVSLAVDPQGRFLYVGKQDPYYSVNLETFSIDSTTGALSPAGALLTGSAFMGAPISVVADPQGELVYALTASQLTAWKVTPTTSGPTTSAGLTAAGATSALSMGPYALVVGGDSPVWQSDCTLDCNPGNTTPVDTHFLDVGIDVHGLGGAIVSQAPHPGIDYDTRDLGNHGARHAPFPQGTTVSLCTPPPTQPPLYLQWTGTGGCGGTARCTSVRTDQDRSCTLKVCARAGCAPSPAPVVFRSSDSDVEALDFTTRGSPSPIATLGATATTLSPGLLAVGLSFNDAGALVRSSSSDLQVFGVDAAGRPSPGTSTSATLSAVGAAVRARPDRVIRASASDLQVFSLTGTALALQGSIGAASSSTGTGVDVAEVGGRSLAVRGYSDGVDVFDISTPTAITLRGNNAGGGLSSRGVGLRVVGNLAVRASSGGLEVYDLTSATPTRLASNVLGGLSGTGVDVATNAALDRIVRATSSGIEVYQLSGTTLTKLGSRNGALSATGVSVAMAGSRVFRAESGGVEEYDISEPTSIPPPTRIATSLSSTGVGLAVR